LQKNIGIVKGETEGHNTTAQGNWVGTLIGGTILIKV